MLLPCPAAVPGHERRLSSGATRLSDLPTRNLSAYFDGLPRRPHASRSQVKIEPSLGRTRAWVISVESQMPQNRGKAAIRRVPTVQISLPPPDLRPHRPIFAANAARGTPLSQISIFISFRCRADTIRFVKPPLGFSWTWTRSSRRCCLRLRNARIVIPLLRGAIDEDRTDRKDIFLTPLFHAIVKGLLLVRAHRCRRRRLLLLGAASRNINQGGDHEYHPSLHIITSEHIVLYLAEGAHQPLSEDGSNP